MNPGAWERGNAPKLGYGVNLKLYGQGNNANSEFVAWIRALLDDNQVPWQTITYRVGSAGGGGGICTKRRPERAARLMLGRAYYGEVELLRMRWSLPKLCWVWLNRKVQEWAVEDF